MSFDTEFDYTNHLTKCDERIASCTALISTLNSELTELASVIGYTDYVSQQIAFKNLQKSKNQDMIARLLVVKTEVNNVIALDNTSKQTLYDFYVASGDKKHQYMLRMLFNHTNIIAEATSLLADGAISNNIKKSIGQSICGKYPISSDAILLMCVKLPEA